MQITTHPAPSNTKIRILSATSFRVHILLFAFAFFLKQKNIQRIFQAQNSKGRKSKKESVVLNLNMIA
jgi:hypothetical protein